MGAFGSYAVCCCCGDKLLSDAQLKEAVGQTIAHVLETSREGNFLKLNNDFDQKLVSRECDDLRGR